MVSDLFLNLIGNWDEAAATFFFRLQASAAHSDHVQKLFAKCRESGMFDNIETLLQGTDHMPVFVPISVNIPNGVQLQMTSMLGKLASIQDALVEGFEIELMLPTDAQSEAVMRKIVGGVPG